MKCVICKGTNIEKKLVNEEVRAGTDVILVPVEVMVCKSCGERYYDRRTMRYLEEIESQIKKEKISFDVVGRVLKARIA
jgi:YgiT-type zinc finger domain-containing protein